MRIYLPAVKNKKGETAAYQFKGKISEFNLNLTEDGDLDLAVNVRGSGDKIIASGTLEAGIQSDCCRCLKPFNHHFKADFQEAFTVVPGLVKSEEPEQLAAEAANQLTVTGDYLYLEEYIRQVFIVAQVYKPLCTPDCKGICAGCGADLNSSSCECREEQKVDSRLAKLKEFGTGAQ